MLNTNIQNYYYCLIIIFNATDDVTRNHGSEVIDNYVQEMLSINKSLETLGQTIRYTNFLQFLTLYKILISETKPIEVVSIHVSEFYVPNEFDVKLLKFIINMLNNNNDFSVKKLILIDQYERPISQWNVCRHNLKYSQHFINSIFS